MRKVIIDTNVLISALISKSYPYYILVDIVLKQNVEICISDDLLKEYHEVINRPKFSRFPEFLNNTEKLLSSIETKSVKYFPTVKLTIISDINDNKLLELADESNADFLITGNTNDFTMLSYKRTKILAPKDYWEISVNENS